MALDNAGIVVYRKANNSIPELWDHSGKHDNRYYYSNTQAEEGEINQDLVFPLPSHAVKLNPTRTRCDINTSIVEYYISQNPDMDESALEYLRSTDVFVPPFTSTKRLVLSREEFNNSLKPNHRNNVNNNNNNNHNNSSSNDTIHSNGHSHNNQVTSVKSSNHHGAIGNKRKQTNNNNNNNIFSDKVSEVLSSASFVDRDLLESDFVIFINNNQEDNDGSETVHLSIGKVREELH